MTASVQDLKKKKKKKVKKYADFNYTAQSHANCQCKHLFKKQI